MIDRYFMQHRNVSMRMLHKGRCHWSCGASRGGTCRTSRKTGHLRVLLILNGGLSRLLHLVGSKTFIVRQQLTEEGETLAVGIDGGNHLCHLLTGQPVLHNLVHSLSGQVGPMLGRVKETTLNDTIFRYRSFQYFSCSQIVKGLFLKRDAARYGERQRLVSGALTKYL